MPVGKAIDEDEDFDMDMAVEDDLEEEQGGPSEPQMQVILLLCVHLSA